MAGRARFLRAEFSKRFEKSYASLTPRQQVGADKAIIALLKQSPTPGMRVKPIQPEKYYSEARINDGDRLVFRVEEDTLRVVDVVEHDDIDRYGGRKQGGV